MQLRPLLFLILSQFSFIATLSFSPDFNGTIPSILGLTSFSYPTTFSHIESGFADGVTNTDFHQPWPYVNIRGRNTYLIRYCFADQASKDALRCSLARAMNLWADALGGKPSEETKYNLHFVQAFAQGEIQLCYAEGTYDVRMAQGTWNWKLANRQDTLVVAYRPVDENGNKPATAASLGYTPEEVLVLGMQVQGRHYMQVSDKDDEVRIAHELGHVFGLLHEHQRSDRDIHIDYSPENIKGYADALWRAISEDHLSAADARTKLRDDYSFCLKKNFPGAAYVKGADQPGIIQGDPSQGPMDFDWDSIMIYPSDAFTDTSACRSDIGKCPLVRRAGVDGSGEKKYEYIPAKYKPSARDAEFVRKHYPWE